LINGTECAFSMAVVITLCTL